MPHTLVGTTAGEGATPYKYVRPHANGSCNKYWQFSIAIDGSRAGQELLYGIGGWRNPPAKSSEGASVLGTRHFLDFLECCPLKGCREGAAVQQGSEGERRLEG